MKTLSFNHFLDIIKLHKQQVDFQKMMDNVIKPEIVKKLVSGQCTEIIAHSYVILDTDHPCGHTHFCVNISVKILSTQDIKDNIVLDTPKHIGVKKAVASLVAHSIRDVTEFDSCMECDFHRSIKNACNRQMNPN